MPLYDKLTPAWYALHTKSRFENVVKEGLSKKSIEVFLPRISVASRRKDRNLVIRAPLFPGYVFVKTDLHPHHQLDVVKTAGVVRFVGSKDGPLPVGEEAIASLKLIVAVDHPVFTGTRFTKGDRVMVIIGPFAGVIGTFVRYRGKDRVVVHVEALGQFAGVDVNIEDIEALPPILS
jgi:transcription elongation factor/antiterminator RfaH